MASNVPANWMDDLDLDNLLTYGSPSWAQSPSANNVGVGSLSTAPGPAITTPPPGPAYITPPGRSTGVETATTSASVNNTIGVGTTCALRQLAGRPATPPGQEYAGGRPVVRYKTPRRPVGGKQPRRVPAQNTSPSSSASGGSGRTGRRRRRGRGGGSGGGGRSGGDSTPPHPPIEASPAVEEAWIKLNNKPTTNRCGTPHCWDHYHEYDHHYL